MDDMRVFIEKARSGEADLQALIAEWRSLVNEHLKSFE
jgi:hypothetical protein